MMRKFICPAVGIVSCFCLLSASAQSDKPGMDKASMQTTWELVSAKFSCMPNDPGVFPKDRCKVKMLSGNQFVWIDYERASGKVLSMAGGSFELKGTQYTERIEFVSQELTNLVGKTFVFQVKLDQNKLYQAGSLGENVDVEETWQKSACVGIGGEVSQVAPRPNR